MQFKRQYQLKGENTADFFSYHFPQNLLNINTTYLIQVEWIS